MAGRLEENQKFLIAENQKDLAAGEKAGLSRPMMDRLRLTPAVIQGMAEGLREVARLPDPVGEVVKTWKRPNGLRVERVRIPIGVIGIIYESRPNVTSDAAGLCLKSGNSVILRGGSEAIHSNQAIGRILQEALVRTGIPEDAIQIFPFKEREAIQEMLQLEDQIDLIIPRGGEELIRFVTDHSRIPVLKHYKGVCHIFIDESADPEMATRICLNAKVQKPAVCNAMETLLVHEKVARRASSNNCRGPSRRGGGNSWVSQNPADSTRDQGGNGGRLVPGILGPHPLCQGGEWNRRSHEAYRHLRILSHRGDPDFE